MSDQTIVKPVQRSRLSQQIVLQLLASIREGRLQPGDRLTAERELADQLQVSRSSLREALRTLEIAGLVESRHGGGTYVRDAFAGTGGTGGTGVSPLALLLQSSGDTVGDLWEIRLIVEPEIAARAAVRAAPEDLDKMEELLHRQEAALGDAETALGIDREFHTALAHASRNAVAVRVLELIGSLLLAGRGHFIASTERQKSALRRHREILAAVRDRSPDEAGTAMRRHLQEVESYIVAALVAAPEESASPV